MACLSDAVKISKGFNLSVFNNGFYNFATTDVRVTGTQVLASDPLFLDKGEGQFWKLSICSAIPWSYLKQKH